MSALEGRAVKLDPPEHFRWLVLRRVKSGWVAKSGDSWLQHGRPVGLFLADFLEAFLDEGLVEVADPSPEDGLSRMSLTKAGVTRYAALCKQQRAPLPPSKRGAQRTENPA